MYLAQKKINGKIRYFIRESYRHEDHFLWRDLLDLGVDPERFIVYPGGNSFYVDEAIEDQLTELGATANPEEIEDIFWGFLNPEIRRKLEPFRCRENRHRADRRKNEREDKLASRIHIFDKRRIHYLRFGQMDQRDIGRLPAKFFRMVYNKSRDEIEQAFMDMETVLSPREYKAYTYVIFNLQLFFSELFGKSTPQMLGQNNVDEHFIEQLCSLSTDPFFWAGMQTGDRLHEYLVRYVLMYFDYDYAPRSLLQDYIRNFINSRRDYRPPHKTGAFILKKASTVFGQTNEALKKMSRQDLARLYRQKAQEIHPDKGGDHDTFVKLTETYHELLKTKN